jgi:zinc protease
MRSPCARWSRRVVWLLALAGPSTTGVVRHLSAQTPEPIVYEVDGLEVGQLVLPDRELVAARLYLLGGSQELTPATAGVERLILAVSERGTEGFPGDSLRKAEVGTGSRFFSSVSPDWSVIGFTGLAEEFDASWTILADRVARPSFDSAAVALVRDQIMTGLRADHDDPDATARGLAEQLAFERHPYAVDPSGTEASLAALTADDLKSFHDRSFVRSRMLLSVVGNVDRATVEAAIRRTLGSLPLGSYSWTPPAPWVRDSARVVVEDRVLPTNYIVGYFGGPSSNDADYPAFSVAVNVLSGYVSSEIRARGLSYSAGASVVERAAAGGEVFVSTVRPGQALDVINDAIQTFNEGSIPRSILRDYAENSSLDYYLSNQTVSQQAAYMGDSLLLTGSPGSVTKWVTDLQAVGGNDVRRMFRKYIKNIQYAYLGAPGAVPREAMLKH